MRLTSTNWTLTSWLGEKNQREKKKIGEKANTFSWLKVFSPNKKKKKRNICNTNPLKSIIFFSTKSSGFGEKGIRSLMNVL